MGLAYVDTRSIIAGNLDKKIAERAAVFEASLARKEAAIAYDQGEKKHADSILNKVRKKLEGFTVRSSKVQQEVMEMEDYQKGLGKAMPARERALIQKRVKYKSQAVEGC
ncbi:MAG: hypothetical protein D3904_18100 [Candidatus Electrothrix sp. EH2]|nr:hypothetical protein [Candidatus Electrothrix sp. EH2]